MSSGVEDRGRWLPRPSEQPAAGPEELACHGRGLRLVDASTDGSAVIRSGLGTRVAAWLAL